MITVTETKEYTAKKAALCWVLKELKFLVKDIDEFIKKYDDVRIAVCNQTVGTDFPTNCDFKYHEVNDRIIARYIMMCSDPFEIIDLYKADYIKQALSSTPATDEAFVKISQQMQVTGKPAEIADEHIKNIVGLVKRRMSLYDTETRIGASRVVVSNVLDSLINGDVSYEELRMEAAQVIQHAPNMCQCGYTKGDNNTKCSICGSHSMYKNTPNTVFYKMIIENTSISDLANAIRRSLSPKVVYTGYDEDVDSIRTILMYNADNPVEVGTMMSIVDHIRQYMVGIINVKYMENTIDEVTDAYREFTIAKNLRESVDTLNKLLRLIGIKYDIVPNNGNYVIAARRW